MTTATKTPIKIISRKNIVRELELQDAVKSSSLFGEGSETRSRHALNEFQATSCEDFTTIDAAFAAANGRASAHTLDSNDVLTTIRRVERQLAKDGVPIADRVGVVVEVEGEVPTANAYSRKSRTAATTYYKIVRRGAGWYLLDVKRVDRYTGKSGKRRETITIPPVTKTAIIIHALKGYAVQGDAE